MLKYAKSGMKFARLLLIHGAATLLLALYEREKSQENSEKI